MGLLSYIKGSRKGREAHELEREAMQDPFLSDALDGYINVEDPEQDARLCRMEEKIERECLRKGSMHRSAAGTVRARHIISPADESVRYVMHDDDDGGLSESDRSIGRRKSLFFWISVAACLVVVCTISYGVGVLRGEKNVEMIASISNDQSVVETIGADDAAETVEDWGNVRSLPEMAKRQVFERKKEEFSGNVSMSPRPSIGYKAYYTYIYDKLCLSAGSDVINGVVVLSFTIDGDGRPTGFEVVEGKQDNITRKIIDIIKDGAVWAGHGRVPSFVIVY